MYVPMHLTINVLLSLPILFEKRAHYLALYYVMVFCFKNCSTYCEKNSPTKIQNYFSPLRFRRSSHDYLTLSYYGAFLEKP